MMSIHSRVAVVKTSEEMFKVSMTMREFQPCVAYGGRRCGHWIFKRERR